LDGAPALFDGAADRFDGATDRFDGAADWFDGAADRFDGAADRFDGATDRFDGAAVGGDGAAARNGAHTLRCPMCSARMRLMATITEPSVVNKIPPRVIALRTVEEAAAAGRGPGVAAARQQ
jgi:hypothetical protein